MNSLRIFSVLLRKDVKLQLLRGDFALLFGGYSFVAAVVVAFGVSQILLDRQSVERLFPTLLWVVFLFTATLSVSKLQDQEDEGNGQQGLLLLGAPPPLIYLAKVVASLIVLLLGHLLSYLTLTVLLNVKFDDSLLWCALVSLLGVISYASIALLLSVVARHSSARYLLFPMLLIPALTPLFFSLIELWGATLRLGTLPWESPWCSLLIGMAAVYPVLGANLYGYLVRE